MKGDDGMIKNKIYAIILLGIGALATAMSNDASSLLVLSLFAAPMFFSKKEWIY